MPSLHILLVSLKLVLIITHDRNTSDGKHKTVLLINFWLGGEMWKGLQKLIKGYTAIPVPIVSKWSKKISSQ